MRAQAALLLLLLTAPLAWADVDPRFAALRDKAEPLAGLGLFLENFVGECEAGAAGAACRHKAEAFRQKAMAGSHYMILNESELSILSPGRFVPATGEYEIHLTPVFSGAGLALTEGAPLKLDKAGNPVVPLLTVKGTLPDNWTTPMFHNLFSRRGIRVQVVFTPTGPWRLAGPGGKPVQGVRARLEGVLFTEARTGQPLGLWLSPASANADQIVASDRSN
jgi:hypothetical protein